MIRDMASGDLGQKTNFGALLRNAHFTVLLAVAAMLATQTGCVSPAGMAQDTAAEAESEQMTTAAQVEALQAEVAALETEVAAAQAATGTAQTMAAQAHEEAGDAQAAAGAAQDQIAGIEAESTAAIAAARATAASAQDQVDMMMAEAHRASAVMIAAGQIDPNLLNFDSAQVFLAGPESIYISSIGYGDDTFSALLRYRGGTTATVEHIFGSAGKLIPDSVDLSRTELTLVAPDTLEVAFVGVGGNGYTGQLRYTGDNRLQVAGIRVVTLPPTAEELVAAAEARADAAIAEARAAADAAVADAAARLAAVEAESAADIAEAQAAVDAALDKVDMMMADAHRPSAVMIDAVRIDPSLLNLDHARVSLAGPESIYVAGIKYGDDTYSALMRYRGGTTATLDKVFGPTGKLIPDSVDLSHTELKLVAPDVLDVANVGVGGQGYSGQLRYAGDNRFEVIGLTAVKLPPTPEEMMAQTEARAAASIAEARAAADASAAEAEAARAAVAEAEDRLAAVEAESAAAIAEARAALAGARDKVDMMMADAHRPSAVMIDADRIDPSLLSLDQARVSLAGPESIYISGIKYGDDTYSALMRYRGGTTATLDKVFGPTGKLIPDSVDLSHTELALIAPDVLDVANVGVGGQGYSGQFRYAGDNRFEVIGLTAVKLPLTPEELAAATVAKAEAMAAAGIAEARAEADASTADAEAARAAVAEAEDAAGRGRSGVRGRHRGGAGRPGRCPRQGGHDDGGCAPAKRGDDRRRPDRSQPAESRPGQGLPRRTRVDLRRWDQVRGRYLLGTDALPRRDHRHPGQGVRPDREVDPRLGRPFAYRTEAGRTRRTGHRQRRCRRPGLLGPTPLRRRQSLRGDRPDCGQAAAHPGGTGGGNHSEGRGDGCRRHRRGTRRSRRIRGGC